MLLERSPDDSSSGTPSTTIRPGGVSSTPTGSAPSSIHTAAQNADTNLSRPFDTSLGNNFTSTSCPTFFADFLNNQTFKDCLPFSLLLQTSNAFFTASRSLLRLTQTLDATCNVNFAECSAYMADLAQAIQGDTACAADLHLSNPVVTQAYNGFLAYPALYHAGCLTDEDGDYCFAKAATSSSEPTSSYVYYLPLGVQLPGGAQPACTRCLQNTMAIFAQSAANASLPLSQDYSPAAEQVQMNCGPSFVEAAVASSTGVAITPSLHVGLTGLLLFLFSMSMTLL